jgi:2-polyprenyl-3-methyl-5-hydroxy-6-metoxy-1,4-benzoquinol methylase
MPNLPIFKNESFRIILKKILQSRAVEVVNRISPYISKKEEILEIGCGLGTISYTLKSRDYTIKALDIDNLSLFNEVQPILYDGTKMPFNNEQFKTSLILTVLHHTPYPDKIIDEAMRVSDKIIIIEDTYTNTVQKYLTYWMDSILNMEFTVHPHTNKSTPEWKKLFAEKNLKIIAENTVPFWMVFDSTMFILEKSDTRDRGEIETQTATHNAQRL